MSMILYDMALSPNCKRARIGLAETGAPFEKREINLLAGQQKGADYRKVHPLGRVPALDDDGFVIWESGAILLYLADKFPDAGLIPKSLAGRGAAYQWLTFGETNIHAFMGPMGFQMLRKSPETRDQSILDRGQKRMPEVLASLDAQLTGKEYILGDFSVADPACAPWLDLAPNLGLDLAPHGNVVAWLERMQARPSWNA
jgi:glutathione S-transferase